ncbi:flavodoxin domain-containing protein [Neobacillus drentensis]|uniref:flavodoxin domain-containing protein n=1 Tax=Neobacillus drentensis TaxID=220684 RepID=UPI003001CE1B
MKCLIVYCSSHGTTEKAVQYLKEQLLGDILTLDLKREKLDLDLSYYDKVIVGGSIHAGRIQRRIKKFIELHHDALIETDLGLFLCCMRDGDTAIEQFNNAFPRDLRKNSDALGLFGGEFLFSKMNFLEKQIVKKVVGVTTEQSNLDFEAIKDFAAKINHLKSFV